MPLTLTLQNPAAATALPTEAQFTNWIDTTLAALNYPQEHPTMTLRIVDTTESATLNETYRGKSGPTNVLSFDYDAFDEEDANHVGDLAICATLVIQEAQQQGIPTIAHWAHLVVHGTLHLLGYDHESDTDASVMEALEIDILAQLDYPNPYPL